MDNGHPAHDAGAGPQAQDSTRAPVTLSAAVEAFFDESTLSANTERSYRAALDAIVIAVGTERPVSAVAAAEVTAATLSAWDDRAPATWNVRRNAVRAFATWAQRCEHVGEDLASGLSSRRVESDRTRAIPFDDLEALWGAIDVDIRERLLWRMLYETVARCGEVLALNIEDIDMANRRAAVTGKGGNRELVIWGSGTARLLALYIAERRRGPLFLAHRAPAGRRAPADTCPHTGRGRLSYGQASGLFKHRSGGNTLHQLRHSALTHLAEHGVSAALLQAKSRHTDIRTLAVYTRATLDPVAEVTRLLEQPPH